MYLEPIKRVAVALLYAEEMPTARRYEGVEGVIGQVAINVTSVSPAQLIILYHAPNLVLFYNNTSQEAKGERGLERVPCRFRPSSILSKMCGRCARRVKVCLGGRSYLDCSQKLR